MAPRSSRAKKPESHLIVLDVSLSNLDNLDMATRALTVLLESKFLTRPAHYASVLLYGTTETSNRAADEQGPGAFEHITTAADWSPISLEHMKALRQVVDKEENGNVDFVDSLIVAADEIIRLSTTRTSNEETEQAAIQGWQTSPTHLYLVSNFATMPQPVDHVTMERLQATFKENSVQLHVISIDIPLDDEVHKDAKQQNLAILDRLCSAVQNTRRSVKDRPSLAGIFKAKEVAISAKKLNFAIGTDLQIPCKLVNKTMKQGVPGYFGREGAAAALEDDDDGANEEDEFGGGGGPVQRVTDWVDLDNPDEPVPPERRIDGYRYGKEVVPVDRLDEESLKYDSGPNMQPGIKLIGFTDPSKAPIYANMHEPLLLVAAKETPQAAVAIESLVRAMLMRDVVAILRYVTPGRYQKLRLLAARPVLATEKHPAHLLCYDQPFQEDFRQYNFSSLNKPEKTPTQNQLDAVRRLVETMSLVKGGEEDLRPENTPNPGVNRTMALLVDRAIDSDFQFPDSDPLLDRITKPSFATMPGALQASMAVAAAFPTKQVTQKAKKVYKLRAGHENEDFKAMMEQGSESFPKALTEMRTHVQDLVDANKYDEALGSLELMRSESVKHNIAAYFNEHYNLLTMRYESRNQNFIQQASAKGLGTVTSQGIAADDYDTKPSGSLI